MRSRAVCAALAAFFVRCASVPPPHPTVAHAISGCYISCSAGYKIRQQHSCRSDSRFMQDITITGEDDVPGDPSESRWFTGATSFGAAHEVEALLEVVGVTKKSTPMAEYSRRYAEELKRVQAELGERSRAAYNKQDVVLKSCQAYRDQVCAELALTGHPCGQFPGEDSLGNPSGTHR
jgi:hypothetical protein